MADQYLILHKVRGEPTFGIAHKIEVLGEERWICSTNDIQCHPIRHWELEYLYDGSDINSFGYHDRPYDIAERIDFPTDWPEYDLFWAAGTKSDGLLGIAKEKITLTLAALGLAQAKPIPRRKL